MTTYVGLVGWPVEHSRSPQMHNAAFAHLGLDWKYLLLPVAPADVQDAVTGIRALRFGGVNVTVPHKQAVMPALDGIRDEARAIGAVNTIVNRDGRLIGHNTDAAGFLRALRDVGVAPSGCRAVVLGAGGAARAVVHALLAEDAQVTIVNRTVERAVVVAQRSGEHFDVEPAVLPLAATEELAGAIAAADLLVNATSVGMSPHVDADPLPAGITLSPTITVYDLVYSPRNTRLLQRARAAGATAVGGLGMLLNQGAVAFELWTERDAPVEVMRAALVDRNSKS